MTGPVVSILVVNYKTPDLTRLCLRLIRRHTDPARIRVIAVDNGSGDDSLDYLRGLGWIELIERTPPATETVAQAHARALDMAFDRVETPYALAIHTDTFVRRPDWLDVLLAPVVRDDRVAGVGSWKLEVRPWAKRAAKAVERQIQRVVFPLIGRGHGKIEGLGANHYYLRSHCALYRVAPVRALGLRFEDADPAVAPGKRLHRALEDAGWSMIFLPTEQLLRYVVHADHATMILNPDLGMGQRAIRKGLRRLQRVMTDLEAERILADASLDR